MTTEKKFQEAEREAAPIHGDILDAIFSHVPLIHLLPACHVSKSWNRAVSSSLRHVNPIKPWLIVHTQNHRATHVTTAHAYDPRSNVWLELHAPSIKHSSALRSSHSTILYTLSANKFSFSFDPLNLDWHHATALRVWRRDPIVACVGKRIVVAGGACEFEDDQLAVEMYDLDFREWTTCQSMPAILKDSSASMWLSVSVAGDIMHVTEKNSGVTYTFDPNTNIWQGPYDLRPYQSVYCSVTGTVRNRLVVAGLVGDAENIRGVELWQVRGELNSYSGSGSGSGSERYLEKMGEMPMEMVLKLKGDSDFAVASIVVTSIGDFVYVHNPSEPMEMVVCEVVNEERCTWRSVRNAMVNDGTRMQRMVFCGGDVGMEYLQRAVAEDCRFTVKET